MHSLLNQQMAQLHLKELEQEICTLCLITHLDNERKRRDRIARYHILWYLLLGQHLLLFREVQDLVEQETVLDWSKDRVNAIIRTISLVTLGIGSLLGGFLSMKFGLFPALLISGSSFVLVSLPILARAVILLREHMLHSLGN